MQRFKPNFIKTVAIRVPYLSGLLSPLMELSHEEQQVRSERRGGLQRACLPRCAEDSILKAPLRGAEDRLTGSGVPCRRDSSGTLAKPNPSEQPGESITRLKPQSLREAGSAVPQGGSQEHGNFGTDLLFMSDEKMLNYYVTIFT